MLQVDIAEELGLDQSTISLELKKIQKVWQAETLFDFNLAKQKELAKKYGVGKTTIAHILRGRTWSYLNANAPVLPEARAL
jgi:Mor family transcriptional regulator